jgi:ribonuclease HI
MARTWSVYIDGAARNNPGLAGIGIYLVCDNAVVGKYGFFVGKKTNNQAEYLAFLAALFFLTAHNQEHDMVTIYSDSLLLVKQMEGDYKVKHPELFILYTIARKLYEKIQAVVQHVPREKNTIADSLANEGIDRKKPLPNRFKEFLKNHDVII